jgi:hypothetical protein
LRPEEELLLRRNRLKLNQRKNLLLLKSNRQNLWAKYLQKRIMLMQKLMQKRMQLWRKKRLKSSINMQKTQAPRQLPLRKEQQKRMINIKRNLHK